MDLIEKSGEIRKGGMEKAAALWEVFELLPQPIAPIDIYKAACSIKCGEFFARIRHNPASTMIATCLGEFLGESMEIVGEEKGSLEEARRSLKVIEKEMPISEEVFNDAVAYAQRQHVYDGIILLSAAKMGKEAEVKACIERLQTGIAKAVLLNMITTVASEISGE